MKSRVVRPQKDERKKGKKTSSSSLNAKGDKKSGHAKRDFQGKRRGWDEEIDSEDDQYTGLNQLDASVTFSQPFPKSEEGTNTAENFPKESEEEARLRIAKSFLARLQPKGYDNQSLTDKLQQQDAIDKHHVHYAVADTIGVKSCTFAKGHTASATCVGVPERDTTKLFTGSKDCSLILWDVNTLKKTIFSGKRKNFHCGGHFEAVLDIAVSSDGHLVASVGRDHVVRLWDTRSSTSKCMATLSGHRQTVTGVCMEPGDDHTSRMYTIGEDKSLHMWNLHMRQREEVFFGHTATPTCIDILQKGRPVTGGLDSTVRVWKIASDSHLLFDSRHEYVDSVCQLNNHRSLSGHQDGSIILWSASQRKPIYTLENAHGSGAWITSLGCVRYSNTFFSGSDSGEIFAWKIAKQTCVSKSVKDTTSNKKSSEISRLTNISIPVTGVVTQMATSGSGDILFASIGNEHRLGRWKCLKGARNGLLITRLNGSSDTIDPVTQETLE